MPQKDQTIWTTTANALVRGERVLLFSVLESSAGSPGRQGFKMLLLADGSIHGTIGGGVMENSLLKEYSELLTVAPQKPQLLQQVHDPAAAPEIRSGMICSGWQWLAINTLVPKDLMTVRKIIAASESDEVGELTLSSSGLEFLPRSKRKEIYSFVQEDEFWKYRELLSAEAQLFIVGAGHVGLALSQVMKNLDFYVTVIDHRKDVHTLERNQYADRLMHAQYRDLAQIVTVNSYVAIVSTTFKTDEAALLALYKIQLRYLGVMGSQQKILHLKKILIEAGATQEEIERIFAPIGLPIKSRSASEIAISIAAELIKIRNQHFASTRELHE